MARLPALLTTDDLPVAELSALTRDGILVPVGSCFAPVDEPATAEARARAAAHGLPGRMIAERMTAAWIWGALPEAPTPHQFCTDLGARVAHRVLPWLELREVVLTEADIVSVGGIPVTTRLRTIADLARFSPRWTSHEQTVVERMRPGVAEHALRAELDRINLPHKRRAAVRLGISPS